MDVYRRFGADGPLHAVRCTGPSGGYAARCPGARDESSSSQGFTGRCTAGALSGVQSRYSDFEGRQCAPRRCHAAAVRYFARARCAHPAARRRDYLCRCVPPRGRRGLPRPVGVEPLWQGDRWADARRCAHAFGGALVGHLGVGEVRRSRPGLLGGSWLCHCQPRQTGCLHVGGQSALLGARGCS